MTNCHIMLDLETLSSRTDAAIVSIGAFKFSPYEVEDEASSRTPERCLDIRVNIDDAMKHGHVSGDTLKWWFKQDPMAVHKTFQDPNNKPMKLAEAMEEFYHFVKSKSLGYSQEPDGVYLWGNGANFDNPIIRHAWAAVSEAPFPIAYNKDMCYRSIKGLVPMAKMPSTVKVGTAHNALDDAIYQARHLQAMYGVMGW